MALMAILDPKVTISCSPEYRDQTPPRNLKKYNRFWLFYKQRVKKMCHVRVNDGAALQHRRLLPWLLH
jgi:hypothetical protein